MMRAARAMTMAMGTKRAMVTDGDNTGNGDGKKGDKRAMVTMTAQRRWPFTLHLERGG
jgi:hypothetical protein